MEKPAVVAVAVRADGRARYVGLPVDGEQRRPPTIIARLAAWLSFVFRRR